MHSPDLTQQNIEKIRALFPNCVTEAQGTDGKIKLAIDFDQLKQELSGSIVEGPQERYHLNWPGKREALLTANAPIAKTLRPCREESVDFDTTQNLFIEGDNLDALKLLQETYLGKVKMIYIDPPYNTGNDFIYEDDFAESADDFFKRSNQKDDAGNHLITNKDSNGRFHSDWLSMMYSRLRLARNLLTDDGVVFISIDDGEAHNLKKTCDEVFGESNFIANIIWQKKYTRSNDAKWFSDNHDHILCFAKEKDKVKLNGLPRNASQLKAYSNPDNHPKGSWKATPLHAKSGTNTSGYTFRNGIYWEPPVGTFRRFNDQAMRRMDETNEIWFGTDGQQTPSRKSFLSDVKDGVTPVTLWPYDEVGHNHEATTELKNLGIGGLFNNPKPSRLINRIITLCTTKDNLVMDFFAGSGTTAHAVMQKNAEDGGNRKFIIVQINESCDQKSSAYKAGFKYISELTRERIKNAANSPDIKSRKIDSGFRVLKIDTSNMSDIYYSPDQISQGNLELWWTPLSRQ